MVGIGASGIIVNAVRILLILSVNNTTVEAYIIFTLSSSFLAYCTFLSNKYVKIYNQRSIILNYKESQVEIGTVATWNKLKDVYSKNWVSALAVCLTFAI